MRKLGWVFCVLESRLLSAVLRTTPGRWLKRTVLSILATLGYRVMRIRSPASIRWIDVLDLVIRDLVREPGDRILVQIGANDGKHGDPVHRYLEEFHWRALRVEPQPDAFQRLRENCRRLPNVELEQCAVGSQDGSRVLYRVAPRPGLPADATGWASFDRDHLLREIRSHFPEGENQIEEITVPTLTISSLLRKHQIDRIDILLVDTEGFDDRVVRTALASGQRPRIIHFEHQNLSPDVRIALGEFLSNEGYELAVLHWDTVARLPRTARSPVGS